MNVKLLRAEWRAVRRASLKLAHHSLSMVGLLAVAGTAVVATHPEYGHAVSRWIVPAARDAAPPAPAAPTADPLSTAIAKPGGEASHLLGLDSAAVLTTASADAPSSTRGAVRDASREKHAAIVYLSKKYRVNPDAIAMLVDAAFTTGHELDLDPLLLLSVMAVESGFNPFAESTAGASGLMQLMSKVHADKLADFGGSRIALNPIVNLRVGAVVLKDCIRRGGSITEGLRLYVGAGTGDDGGYGARVLQEKDRLAQAVRGGRPLIEPIPSTVAKVRPPRQPGIDHSMDSVDPNDPKIDAAAGSIAAL